MADNVEKYLHKGHLQVRLASHDCSWPPESRECQTNKKITRNLHYIFNFTVEIIRKVHYPQLSCSESHPFYIWKANLPLSLSIPRVQSKFQPIIYNK